MISFAVLDWAAWAPGLSDRLQWMQWKANPALPSGTDAPALEQVPAMLRRRMDQLARMAIEVALSSGRQAGDDEDIAWIFASRHGEVARSLGLLESVATQSSLSPIGFGLSVHNAAAASYSIITSFQGNYLALAGARATVEHACIEAAGLLQDGCREVRLVVCDVPLPALYSDFADEPQAPFAWCWRLAAAGSGGVDLSLAWGTAATGDAAVTDGLPAALDRHRFLLSTESSMQRAADGQVWHWKKHG